MRKGSRLLSLGVDVGANVLYLAVIGVQHLGNGTKAIPGSLCVCVCVCVQKTRQRGGVVGVSLGVSETPEQG